MSQGTDPAVNGAAWEIKHGDVRAGLSSIAPGTVQTCITSPPYWGLRDYGTGTWEGGENDHAHDMVAHRNGRGGSGTPGKNTAGAFPSAVHAALCSCGARRVDHQIGLEATVEEWIDTMVDVFRGVRDALRDDGTLWLNLGDAYASSAGDCSGEVGKKSNLEGARQNQDETRKARAIIRNAAAHSSFHRDRQPKGDVQQKIAAGAKPKDLIGMPWRTALALRADGWFLRSDIIWSKPNPMPESVTDRPTKSHEYLFLLSKSSRYYYNADAVREPLESGPSDLYKMQSEADRYGGKTLTDDEPLHAANGATHIGQKRGVGKKTVTGALMGRNRRSVWTVASDPFPGAHFATYPEKLIEPCILAGSRPDDLVLDPFTGSGTTGVVALRNGRRFVGCELSAAYVKMADRRIREQAGGLQTMLA
jgi:DNA modification methylase